MTNNQIIWNALAANGMTETQLGDLLDTFGELPFHTYAEWKKRGRQVKRGEHAVLKGLLLWAFTNNPTAEQRAAAEASGEDPDTLEGNPHFYKRPANLFALTQTDVITAREPA